MQCPDSDLDLASIRLRQSLRSYLRRRLPDEASAEDLLQDLLVKALVAQQSGQKIGNLLGWLYAAARTTVSDYYRARGTPMQELDDELAQPDVEDISLHAELSQCLLAFVGQLPPLYRDTLLATDIRGATMRSLAEQEQVSVSAIKSRASRARTLLKAKLLACCRVEMSAGLVSDYIPLTPGCGSGPCH
ncbi:sigma-70 family RNA polymerase sigma factor [Chitinilyticum aquatile]|uniref:sigma-70 family RNA polymerase sigma factor n=1 Tax=Chitinilyticum aquatile TaxID=362520 RepID=UPI00040C04E0|nr:sigma-70 family RNA polymerase sigma factor [Chitinilyticum aquatile]